MNYIKKVIYSNIIPLIGKIYLTKNKYCNVIYYHDITESYGDTYQRLNFEHFKKQMEYIHNAGYQTIRFDELNNDDSIRFEQRKIIIAFDDGWKSNYDLIYDFMQEREIKYNIFLAIGEIDNNPEYLSWKKIKQMHSDGLVGFGIHTYSHPRIHDINKINTDYEFNYANQIFKQQLGYEPEDFCYPYGDYTAETNEYITLHTKYKRIYTSDMMVSYKLNNKIIFGRNGINNIEPFSVFKFKLRGYYNCWKKLMHK